MLRKVTVRSEGVLNFHYITNISQFSDDSSRDEKYSFRYGEKFGYKIWEMYRIFIE